MAQFAQSQTPPQKPLPQPTPSPGNAQQKPAGEEIDEEDVVRVKTTLITSPVLVIGRNGKYIPTLRREDFHVFEEGVEQNLAYFAPVDRPITLALVIDASRSTVFELRNLQDAAISFVNEMRPDDQALIVSFADEVQLLAEPTSDRDILRRAILSARTGGATRVYDAVDFVINQKLAGITGRKAIVLLTDGVDTASRDATYQTNLNDAAKSEALIYAIQFSTRVYMAKQAQRVRRAPPEGSGFSRIDYQRADAYLHQISDLTGAPLYPAANTNDLDRAVARIAEELHNEYSVGYYPPTKGAPGEVRRIEVRINQPRLVVRARTSYAFDESGAAVAYATKDQTIVPSELTEMGSLSSWRSLAEPSTPLNARWICKGPNTPGDFAVVKEGFDAKCPASNRAHDQTNAWFIKKPAPSETICKGFVIWNGREIEGAPIPTGYAVVGQLISSVCSRSNNLFSLANAWSVKTPGSTETVCKGFLIPR
ncbi:MAG: VWA domain-containing protein, partial [Acidobacteriota bacterium]